MDVTDKNYKIGRRARWLTIPVLLLIASELLAADQLVTLTVRSTEISEVMEMLSRSERTNILLSPEVVGEVSFSLYEVELSEAIRYIASAAGYAVEMRNNTYFIVSPDSMANYADSDMTIVKTFEIEYNDPALVQAMLTPYLSPRGKMSALVDRQLLVVEDRPDFIVRIRRLLKDIDRAPRQIMIEAQILEVTLSKEDSQGVDWARLFASNGGDGSIATRGLANAGGSSGKGLLFTLDNEDIVATLTALEDDGRIRTLSTPKLLALENREASVIVGDRRGFQVTTTINQVTTESIEFLESGVILRVTPQVDQAGRIMLDIHPEVSTGTVDANGIPSQTTTEVSTRLLVDSGETVFVGGLIKQNVTQSRSGVPGLSRVPGVGLLFSSRENTSVNTETIVLIKPVIVEPGDMSLSLKPRAEVEKAAEILDTTADDISAEVDATFREFEKRAEPTETASAATD